MYPKASEPSDLAKGLRDNFASGYLTLISIVLGVALGLLAQNLFPNPKPPGFSTRAYPLSFLTFLIICGTFHYYYFWVSFIRIYPTFNQVLLPFLAGSGVIVLAADPSARSLLDRRCRDLRDWMHRILEHRQAEQGNRRSEGARSDCDLARA